MIIVCLQNRRVTLPRVTGCTKRFCVLVCMRAGCDSVHLPPQIIHQMMSLRFVLHSFLRRSEAKPCDGAGRVQPLQHHVSFALSARPVINRWLKQMDTKTLLAGSKRVRAHFLRTSSKSLKCSFNYTIIGVFLVTAGHLRDRLHQNQNAIQMCHSHSWRCLSWLETYERPVSSGITFTVRTSISGLKKVIFVIPWIQGISKAVASWL